MWFSKPGGTDRSTVQCGPQTPLQRRTAIVAVLVAVVVAGCGFKLRGNQTFAFETLAVTPERNGLVAADLIRYFSKAIVPLAPVRGSTPPQVIVDVLHESREKTPVSINASGQVREFQLKLRLVFRMRLPDGRELIAPTEISQQRDISFNESVVLAKEAEEVLLFRDMQNDILQQLLRRLASVKSLDPQ